MDYTIKSFNTYQTRSDILKKRVGKHPPCTARGDTVDVRALLAGNDGRLSSARAAELARRLTDIVDALQKPYWFVIKWVYWLNEGVCRQVDESPEWQEFLEQHQDAAELRTFDLNEAPTTLSAVQRHCEDPPHEAKWAEWDRPVFCLHEMP